uniref:Thyrotropin-releasing hormone receptor n=1 Tax=Macrostomum lignano TaxID=282301 RepID=A0A1I8INZ4_9PLAT
YKLCGSHREAIALPGRKSPASSPSCQEPKSGSGMESKELLHMDQQQQESLLYYDIPIRVTGTALSLLILCIGFVGNVLVMAVVLTARGRMITTTNCYLVSLSLADLVVLIVGAVTMVTELNIVRDRWLLCGLAGCKLSVYLTYVGVNTSAFSITAFSLERWVAICHPITAKTACTVRRAFRIIAGIWTFGLAYNAPWLYLATVRPTRPGNGSLEVPSCQHKLARSDPIYMSLYLADLSLFYVVPLLLLSGVYTAIARALFRSSASRSNGRDGVERRGGRCCGSDTGSGIARMTEPLRSSNTARLLQSRIQPSGSLHPQVVKMLFVVVTMFAFLWLPYRLMVAYNSFAAADRRLNSEWFVAVSRLLIFVNSAINPVIYNAMSGKFRREFKRLLRCSGRFLLLKQSYILKLLG